MPSLAKRLFRKMPVTRSTRAYEFALTHLHLSGGGRLLDLGAGQGYGSAFLSRAFPAAQVFGLDITFECRQDARPEHGPRPPLYIQGSAPFLPIADNSVDAIFAVMTFHCLPQPAQVIAEAGRVLRSGGALALADVNGDHWMARPFEWFEHRFISPLTRAWRADELRDLAESAGLKDVTVHHRPGRENGFMQWLIAHK